MIITRTPFRVSFAGGGSDLASYYESEPGAVLSTAIDKYRYRWSRSDWAIPTGSATRARNCRTRPRKSSIPLCASAWISWACGKGWRSCP